MELNRFILICDGIVQQQVSDTKINIDHAYEKIKQLCDKQVYIIRQKANSLLKQLIIMHVCEDRDLLFYINLLNILLDGARNPEIVENYKDASNIPWEELMIVAYQSKDNSHFFRSDYDALLYRKKDVNLAHSCKFLKEHGFGVVVDEDRILIDSSSYDGINLKINSLCQEIGGFKILQLAFNNINGAYDEGLSRFHITRVVTQGVTAVDYAIPWGYIIALGVKNINHAGSDEKCKSSFLELLDLTMHIISVFEVQPYSVWEAVYLSSNKLIEFLQDCVVYDNLVSFFQINSRYSKSMIRYLTYDFIQSNHQSFNFSLKDIVKLANTLIDMSHRHEVKRISANEIANKAKLPIRKVHGIIDNILHAQSGNRSLGFPPSSVNIDHNLKPLFKNKNNYYLLPKSITSLSVLNSVLGQISRPNGKFDNPIDGKLGDKVEDYIRNAFNQKGIITYTGEVFAGKGNIVGESDIIIESSNCIFLFEIKKKSLTRKAMSGEGVDLLIDLAASVLRSQCQAFKMEYLLRLNGEITLVSNGGETKIHLNNREIRRVSVSLHDFGSLQDNITLKTILNASISSIMHACDPLIDPKLDSWRNYVKDINNYLILMESIPPAKSHLFQDSAFMSVPQILTILEDSNTADEFYNHYRSAESITFSTRDFYKEFALRNRTN
ncbi:hypothetical protein [Serratia sp. Res13-Sevr-LER1-36-b]|uniref:hypothetical protein n=3 Tax=unclassified Serratia (in: enterobacteria) TaxID=2647522 RepID=UPI0018A88499|nr:hypothetical protein [Serratia sp. Res13-Sevr-LER1-36-b]